jgi:hypothetical protein
MNVNSVSGKAVGAAVWTNSTRTVTSLGAGVGISFVQNGSLAASTSLNIQPAAGTIGILNLCVHAGSAGASNFYANDSTNALSFANVSSGNIGSTGVIVTSNGTYFEMLNTDASHAATYNYSMFTLTP